MLDEEEEGVLLEEGEVEGGGEEKAFEKEGRDEIGKLRG